MSKQERTIEMPPLDYQFPQELHPETAPETRQAAPVQTAPVQKTEQQLAQERPVYQDYEEPVQNENMESNSGLSALAQDDTVNQHIEPEQDQRELKFQQNNFKAMREEAKRVQKERDILEYQLEQMKLEQQERNRPKVQEEPEIEFDFSIDDDALIDAKVAKQLARKYQQNAQEIKQMREETQQTRVEAQVKAKYPDWDRVVSKANVEKFASMEPELAESLRQTKDPYLQLVSAYKMIRNSNLYVEPIDVTSTVNDDRRRIAQNNAQPRPTAAVSPNNSSKALSAAADYAVGRVDRSELAKQNKIMNDIIRGPR